MVNQARDGADAGLTRTLPKHLAYAPLAAELPPEEKRTPSLLAAELKGEARLPAALRRPRIVGLLNMSQYTHNVTSVVPLEEPLFQPSPPEVVFESFEPLNGFPNANVGIATEGLSGTLRLFFGSLKCLYIVPKAPDFHLNAFEVLRAFPKIQLPQLRHHWWQATFSDHRCLLDPSGGGGGGLGGCCPNFLGCIEAEFCMQHY